MTRAAGNRTAPVTRRVTPPDEATVARLRLVVARLYRQMVQASGRQDLTLAQLSALAKIEEHGPLRVGELAGREGVAGPSMIRTVAPLAESGLILREPDPTDGRSYLLSVAPAGTELLAQIRRDRSELLTRRAARLTPAELAALEAAIPVLELLLHDDPGHGPHST